ncbi:protein CYPRO4-like [Hibiscus syriacus]|uniref:Protein CYPRO4-like n=1 Tax=Hibiscus syriacus TaxID=106335 RepID=A0A6A2Y3Z6_HIBSY|nr:protein SENESCENCE-ASSOCIATED GENE 21, mitochondrial-like [Hibiscus syriacus]XP_039043571.1 protein SENESCENCE-ASSOCIATED GENE 21, mitochondrial-like [Hibiscus syriacus]KAE8664897.1 protein CYPRO4-like [Hibiscus syriacus]
MARSFSNVKLFSIIVLDGISNAISRRGYAATSQGVLSNGVKEAAAARNEAVLKKTGEDMAMAVTKENVNWVPDPKTGFYRPENSASEICPAELRATLLKRN